MSNVLVAVAAISLIGAACTKKTAALKPCRRRRPPLRPRHSHTGRDAHAVQPHADPDRDGASAALPNAATRARIDELLARIEDAYFDYNKHHLTSRCDQRAPGRLHGARDILKDFPDYKLRLRVTATSAARPNTTWR